MAAGWFWVNKSLAGKALCLACFTSLTASLLSISFLSHSSEVGVDFSIEASSEPVSISDMINGWDNSVNAGDYAYASGIASVYTQHNNFYLSAERRYYYYYEFTPDTVAWYADVERGVNASTERKIELDVTSFDARGVTGGYLFEGEGWQLLPAFTLYKLGHYQLGSLNGISSAGEGTNASAYLDYYFDEDKILNYQAEEDLRFGYSLSLAGQYQWNDRVLINVKVTDLWNRFEFFQASYRQGCINVGTVEESVCDLGGGAASGIDTNKDHQITLSPTIQLNATYAPHKIEADLYWHEKYVNLTLGKYFELNDVQIGLLASTKRQMGVDLKYKWVRFNYLADNLQMNKVRDGRLQLSASYQW